MEATLSLDEAPALNGAVEASSDAGKTPAQVFKYADHVHVGPGAADCPHGTDGQCEEAEHFHAFCRLPNQFQHSDIRQRALAAKARRLRQLKDPEADSYQILEADMEILLAEGDREALVDELVNAEWYKDHLQAVRELQEGEGDKDSPWATVDKDRERLQQILALDPDRRPAEEQAELERHLAKYDEAVEKTRDAIQKPRRDAMGALEMSELVDLVRKQRIDAEVNSAFMETYSKWEWFSGTTKPTTGKLRERVFATIDELEQADVEIINALRDTFSELEAALQRGATGN